MGYGYLFMGVTMSILTVTLSFKVNTLHQKCTFLFAALQMINYVSLIQDLNSWIPYMNIALIFCVICIYGLGPCEFSHASSAHRWIISQAFFIQRKTYCFIFLQRECLWLSLPTSSYKPGDLLPMWSVGPSAGWACSLWVCCSATLWWDICCVSSQIIHIHLSVWLLYLTQSDFMCASAGWTRPVLLPDFCGLHFSQCSISFIFCPRDQRKDNGRNYGGLQQIELQEKRRWHWDDWHWSNN